MRELGPQRQKQSEGAKRGIEMERGAKLRWPGSGAMEEEEDDEGDEEKVQPSQAGGACVSRTP